MAFKKSNSKPQRIDEKFKADLQEIARVRVGRGLAKPIKEEMSMREMTKLLTKTTNYPKALEELRWKKKNVKA